MHYLQSFPTRRSSDLDLLVRLLQRGAKQLAEAVEVRLQVRLVQVPAVDAPGGPWIDAVGETQADALAGEPVREDRKSTRLNSSHLVFSYAVFCMKKNNATTSILLTVVIFMFNVVAPVAVSQSVVEDCNAYRVHTIKINTLTATVSCDYHLILVHI